MKRWCQKRFVSSGFECTQIELQIEALSVVQIWLLDLCVHPYQSKFSRKWFEREMVSMPSKQVGNWLFFWFGNRAFRHPNFVDY